MSLQNKRNRKWGYLIILKTDTDFKEELARNSVEKYLGAIQRSLNSFEPHPEVEMVYRKLNANEVSNFEAGTAGTS